MSKFTKIWGSMIGAAAAIHGVVLAVSGNRLLSPSTRHGSQHYWSALIGVFGEEGSAFVSGFFWFAIGVIIIWLTVTPRKYLPAWIVGTTTASRQNNSRRKSRKRA